MLKDLRHAIRMLWQAKGWTTVVVLSLALGIGANTALFSAMNGMLLTKVPVKDPDTLVRFLFWGRNDMSNSSSGYGYSNEDTGWAGRPGLVFVSDVQAVRRRQPDDDGSLRVRAAGTDECRRRRAGRPLERLPCVRQLFPGSRRVSAPGSHDRSRRRYAVGDACGGHQLEILALPIRYRSERRRTQHQGQ